MHIEWDYIKIIVSEQYLQCNQWWILSKGTIINSHYPVIAKVPRIKIILQAI